MSECKIMSDCHVQKSIKWLCGLGILVEEDFLLNTVKFQK